ncbi:M23 family metallopeptidase [Candidatus Shapirobacteria bacterium]|nr:M23 family metallopeptidase [Candidatus Shapirobacteria bacterium]
METRKLLSEGKEFVCCGKNYFWKRLRVLFCRFEQGKSVFAAKLYERRGRWTRPFSHLGFATLVGLGIVLAPVVAENLPEGFLSGQALAPTVLSAVDIDNPETATFASEKPRGEVMDYTVIEGDTISGIAQKFSISIDTIRWANNLQSISSIKPGQNLKILPVTGVSHKVARGETVYSIAKHYSSDPQGIVDYPFNAFKNDETFELAAGQMLIVPDGIMPKVIPWAPSAYIARKTPDAGTVVASGVFVWPAGGTISQRYSWYHHGVDIANAAGPDIVAADAGRIVVAGWPDNSGYGNRVMIDHGNGLVTIYGHLAKIYVASGQTVNRGNRIGQMGTTGRSTGIHLHFEVRRNGASVDPMSILK